MDLATDASEPAYTPALADLMEHEKVIEQGLGTFVEVGNALLAIRDGKKYRAAGFHSFDAYCRERWTMSRTHADRLIVASKLAPLGVTSEGEARRVLAERRQPPQREHPAPFSDAILAAIAPRVSGANTVLDPFAGIGRVHELRNAGVERTIGVELEPEWAATHPDTIQGDALALDLADASVDAIATSPTYGNRMADHHDARDDSVRLTYKHTVGHDLTAGNSGAMQWGDDYRAFHRRAWIEAIRVLKPGGTFVVNVKDHIRDGCKQDVVAWHIATLHDLGLHIIGHDVIPTRGLMAGDNATQRVCAEVVLTFTKATA
jgi:hypothetical protein